jgi:hypothetical protein
MNGKNLLDGDYAECGVFNASNRAQSYPDENSTAHFNRNISKEILSLDEIKQKIIKQGIYLLNGGKYYNELNKNCTVNKNLVSKRIAFIIPYRNRLSNLKIFLNNIHEFMSKRNVNYGIYLIEPVINVTFNRGLLMNVGFVEAIKDTIEGASPKLVYDLERNLSSIGQVKTYWDCFVFHDVDMIVSLCMILNLNKVMMPLCPKRNKFTSNYIIT